MDAVKVIELVVFLWLGLIFLLLWVMRSVRPYQPDSEEQRADDLEQKQALSEWLNRQKAKRKSKRGT
jgi:hypothetical protein